METIVENSRLFECSGHSRSTVCFHSDFKQQQHETGQEILELKKSRKDAEKRLLCMRNRINRLKKVLSDSSRTQKLKKERTEKILKARERHLEFKREIQDKSEAIKQAQLKKSKFVSKKRIDRKIQVETAKNKAADIKKQLGQDAKNFKEEIKKHVDQHNLETFRLRKDKALAIHTQLKEQAHKRAMSDQIHQESLSKKFFRRMEQESSNLQKLKNTFEQLQKEEKMLKEILRASLI